MGEAAALQTGAPLRALVLGGYGNFGARIVRALAGDAAIQLVVAGRDVQRARALIDGHYAYLRRLQRQLPRGN